MNLNKIMDCIFCKIVKGEIPAHKIYEDQKVLVFLDITPVSKGHCLVIPKEHVENFYDLDDQTYMHLFGVVKGVSEELKLKFKSEKIGEMIQGFEVAHAHVHVFPLDSKEQFSLNRLDESISTKDNLKEAFEILTSEQ